MNIVEVVIVRGDITDIECDAIVNPANSLMIMGGGVAGAIKRKGGAIIEEEAKKRAPVPVGEAIATTAGRLKARYVIHSPTMERPAMRTTPEKVVKAIKAALDLACSMGLREIAFPGMGTGVGGLSPLEGAKAFRVAIEEFMEEKECPLKKIILVAFTDDFFRALVDVVGGMRNVQIHD